VKIEVRGHSDDTFGVYGKGLWGPDDCDDHVECARMTLRAAQLTASNGRMMVCGQYGQMPEGTWFIGIAQVDEDDQMPPWPMIWTFDGYSPVLIIVAPDDCKAEWVKVEK
jgi:hypothetical protein